MVVKPTTLPKATRLTQCDPTSTLEEISLRIGFDSFSPVMIGRNPVSVLAEEIEANNERMDFSRNPWITIDNRDIQPSVTQAG